MLRRKTEELREALDSGNISRTGFTDLDLAIVLLLLPTGYGLNRHIILMTTSSALPIGSRKQYHAHMPLS